MRLRQQAVVKQVNMMKILWKLNFDTDDDLSLNKPLTFLIMTIVVRSIFEDEGKFYPQVYLDECLYQL